MLTADINRSNALQDGQGKLRLRIAAFSQAKSSSTMAIADE